MYQFIWGLVVGILITNYVIGLSALRRREKKIMEAENYPYYWFSAREYKLDVCFGRPTRLIEGRIFTEKKEEAFEKCSFTDGQMIGRFNPFKEQTITFPLTIRDHRPDAKG